MPELDFKGKEFVRNHHLTVPYRPLVPVPEKGIGEPDLNGNLIIHGDNLEALKALLPLYAGKVDCIFIDPPYNTGNEGWAYNDNVNSPIIKAWFDENPVGVEDGLRHDKWCCMMWPRLKLLRELLANTGSVWVTLDGNEAHNASVILDEIFGAENKLAMAVWEKADSPRMDARGFSVRHDTVLVYARDAASATVNRVGIDDEPAAHYTKLDKDGRLYYLKPLRRMVGSEESREARPNLYYALLAPDGTEVYPKTPTGGDGTWRWSRKRATAQADRIEWVKGKSGWAPFFRIYADSGDGKPPETIFYNDDVGSSRTAKAQLKEIFPEGTDFDTPKPIGLVIAALMIATKPNSIVLDSFAGSGTTAHAVMQLNDQDGGARKYILVEMEDYADSMTAERVRRVIGGYSFQGKKRSNLLEHRITWTDVRRSDSLVQDVNDLKAMHEHDFDDIEVKVDNGVLRVVGVKNVADRVKGLGGAFAYCELGAPLELQGLLSGTGLPERDALAEYLLYIAGIERGDLKRLAVPTEVEEHYLGSVEGLHVWLMYRADRKYLSSTDSALTLEVAKAIHRCMLGGKHRVYSPAKYVGTKTLREEGVEIEHVPLPLAIFRGSTG
jgi:adenine-specific DNA-methyltransferase